MPTSDIKPTLPIKRKYLVHPKGGQTGQFFDAHEAVIELSGALGVYVIDDSGRRQLIKGYAPGTWQEVSDVG